jgi:ParB family chromosome partitioning protein
MDSNKIKKGLGRGLSSLIGETKVEEKRNHLPVSEIVPNKYQPRKWLAAQKAGLHTVPVLITEADDLKSLEFAIIENVQRHDLNPLEEAQGYKRLIDEFEYDQEKVSKFIGKSRSHVANCLRLLTLPNEIINLIETQKITAGHAKILVGLENSIFIANKIIEKKLSVRQSENLVKIFKNKTQRRNNSKDVNITDLEKSISEKIGLSVVITNNKSNKGTITLSYKEIDQLNKIIEILKSNY